jgi:hypothetical protein
MTLLSPLFFILVNTVVVESEGGVSEVIKERETRKRNPINIAALISKLNLFV